MAILLLFLVTMARADVTLMSDPFADGNRTNTTGGDTLGGVWWQNTTNTGQVTIVDDTAGIGTGNAMQLVPSGDFHKIITFFSGTTLANPGDTIKATFDYRFPTAPTSAGDGFRIGLGNSNGTKQSSDTSGSGSSTRTDDKNYGFNTNVGGASSTGTGVKYEDAGDDILGGSGAGTRFGFGTGGASVASGTTKHSALLQITRLTNGDLYVLAQVDNLAAASGTHPAASVLTYTFDEFAYGFGGTGYRPTILMDNVVITSTALSVLNITATTPTATSEAPAVLTVTRSNGSGALTVPYTLSGTAVNGTDYQTLSGTVSFANGQTSATITITPIAAYFIETSKTVTVTLGQPTGAIVQTGSATATIVDSLQVWTGQITPQFSETYTFYVTSPNGARLWIDDRMVVARSFPQSGEMRGEVALTAGQSVNLRLESLDTYPGSNVTLEWSSPSQPRQVVPQARLSQPSVAKAGGSILVEHWLGIPGSAISSLTSNANFPSKPSGRELNSSFECLAQNWADSYGTRVTGYIVPPATGNYTFAVSGDDTCQLFLSTDSTSANEVLIASVASATGFRQWNAQPSQQSAPVSLVQGQRYYVEMLHKEDTGTDHWSVGWMKPGDSAFSVIPGSALVQAGLDRAQPAQANLLDTLATAHPRLLATTERFLWLQSVYQSSTASIPKTWATNAVNTANTILGQPPVTYTLDATGDLLNVARTVKDRINNLGVAWWVTGNNAYADRAWTELNAVADNTAFPDWNPPHFLDTAEMTHACALGYDWFYNYWTQAQRDTIRTAIINKGLAAGQTQYTSDAWWSRSTGNNWNLVCNGGLALGALAIADENVTQSEDVLNRALNSLRPVMSHFTADDGAWYEGPGYWNYETIYGTRMLGALEWALGSDFGLSATPMFSETGFHAMCMNGPTGQSFNFSDGGTTQGGLPVSEETLEWHARRFNQPLLAWYENTYGGGPLAALWYNATNATPASTGFARDMAYHGQNGTPYYHLDAVTLRGNWTDPRTTFLGTKGGWMGADHGNLDAGDFVLDALGHRWFQDLGPDDYGLPGYFTNSPATNPNRWNYYRTRGEGQNTIILDPGSGPDMTYDTVAPMVAYQSSPTGRRSMTILSLTPSTAGVSRLWRGFQLMGDRNQVLVQDEIVSSTPHTVWWFAHFAIPSTSVAIDPDGTAVTLTQGSDRLWCKIVSGGGTFQVMNATPLPTSPNPSGQNANTGYQKLAINLTNVTSTTLAVWMVPLSPGDIPPTALPAITPLSTWNIAATNDPPVTAGGAVTTVGDGAVTVDLRNYVTDDATYPNAMTFSVGNALSGTVTLLADGHTAVFTPNAGYVGIPSFTYTATDSGGLSSTGTITVSAVTGTQVWNAAANGVWSNGANWASAVAPASSRGNTIEFFTGSTLAANVTATNDTGSFAMNVFTLNGTASAVADATIAGSGLTLTNNGSANAVINLNAPTGSGLSYDINTPLTLAVATTAQGSGSAAFRFNGDTSGAGSLTKAGSSTLILAGTNTYAGGTTISNGTLQIGNGGSTGTLAAGTVTNNATLRFYRGDTVLNVSNVIGGTGSVQVGITSGGSTTSIVTLSGANTFTGNVTGNSGGIRISNASALGSGTKTLTMANGNGGNPYLRLDGSGGAIDLPATISYTVSNSATTNGAFYNEAGNNIIRGNVTITSGNGDTRLIAAAGALTFTGNFAPNITSRNLQLAGAASGTISGNISDGTAPNTLVSITKSDPGTWTLSGAITHTGTIVVNTGRLNLNGSVSGPSALTVAGSGTLGGNGTIAPNTTISGTHSPGVGAGVQTFTGSLSYGAASHVAWELAANANTNPGVNFDNINAAGVTVTTNAVVDVVLNPTGGNVSLTDPFWAQTHTWTALNATSISGTFKLGTVSADSAGRAVSGYGAFSLQQTSTAVNVVWTPAPPFQQWQAANFGTNWNNPAIAGPAVDPYGRGLPNLVTFSMFGPTQSATTANVSLLPQVQKNGGNFVCSFTEPAGVSGVTYAADWRSDLKTGSWLPITDTGTGTTHIFSVPIGSNAKLFIRLRVSTP
ncbi:autotransporter-associated beta strand protein [Chthoniobacter flavus]|uniref:PA14 domain-containing protein n=1 Tax=Chthoniobacter flavus TaxID=191863 RepID=UPI0002DC4B4A|nr:PA14 domain-containing protein [Chthoniobacter flavus]TCO94709.1 autotransporter-associated beta strand protein [Chthoniobacter flavus]